MLLGRELLHQQVGVVDDEAAEDQSSGSSKDQLCAVAVEKKLKRKQSRHQKSGGLKASLYSFTGVCV